MVGNSDLNKSILRVSSASNNITDNKILSMLEPINLRIKRPLLNSVLDQPQQKLKIEVIVQTLKKLYTSKLMHAFNQISYCRYYSDPSVQQL